MIFTIKKDQHFNNQFCFKMLNLLNISKNQAFTTTFTNSCIYTLPNSDQEDINKLFGFSCGMHHKNSARFGWSYINNKIQLWAYYYNDTQRYNTYITSLELNKPYQLYLNALESYYEFLVEHDYAVVARIKVPRKNKKTIGYNLWPYFGGNNSAPHDIKIQMVKID